MSFIILLSNSVNSIHIYWFPISSPTDFRFWLSLYRTLKIDYILSRFNSVLALPFIFNNSVDIVNLNRPSIFVPLNFWFRFKSINKSGCFQFFNNSKLCLGFCFSNFIRCFTSISSSIIIFGIFNY
uniref:Candidate secreted effector n=1 Tax=Meloidogyne incognita TaxID=6306 RepID=A0A914ML40_MELIC